MGRDIKYIGITRHHSPVDLVPLSVRLPPLLVPAAVTLRGASEYLGPIAFRRILAPMVRYSSRAALFWFASPTGRAFGRSRCTDQTLHHTTSIQPLFCSGV